MTSLVTAFADAAPKAASPSVQSTLSGQFLSASLSLMTRDTRSGIDAETRKDLEAIRAHNDSPRRTAWANRYVAAAGKPAASAPAAAHNRM